jgi:hypothetical protein
MVVRTRLGVGYIVLLGESHNHAPASSTENGPLGYRTLGETRCGQKEKLA